MNIYIYIPIYPLQPLLVSLLGQGIPTSSYILKKE